MQRPPLTIIFCCLLGWSALLAQPSHAQPQPSEKGAGELYAEGITLFKDGRFEAAARAFESAYRTRPSWKILFNSGQSWAAAKHHGLALQAFERYLADGGDEVPKEREAIVLSEIGRLKNLVATVAVEAVDGARIEINGVERGSLPEATHHKVGVGEAVVRIYQGDALIHEQRLVLTSGSTVRVSVIEGAAPLPSPADRPDPPASGDPPVPEAALLTADAVHPTAPAWGWVVTGAGVAVLGAGAAMGALGYTRASEIKADECESTRCPPRARGDLVSSRNTAIVGDVLMGVGLATSLVGALGLFRVFEKEPPPDGPPSAWKLSPNPDGVVLTGAF